MKRISLCFAAVLAAFVSVNGALAQTGGLRYTITVSEFTNDANWEGQANLGHAWQTVMTDLMNQNERFIVLGDARMRANALEEQDLGASDRAAKGAKTPERGHMTPAQLLLRGSITDVQVNTGGGNTGLSYGGFKLGANKQTTEINTTIYLVDASTGQVVASTSVVGKAKKRKGSLTFKDDKFSGDIGGQNQGTMIAAIEEAAKEAMAWLVVQLPEVVWRGTVVLVEGEQVYVNRGDREGVQPGQIFLVGESKVIRDPETGEILDQSVVEIARLEATTVKPKLTICKVLSGDERALHNGLEVQIAK